MEVGDYNIILLHICYYLHNFLFTVMEKVEVGTLDEQELEKFVTDRLPTLKGKDFKIVF